MIMSNQGMIMITSEGSEKDLIADYAGLIRGMCTDNRKGKLLIPKDMLVALTGAIAYTDVDIVNRTNIKLLQEKVINKKEAKMYLEIYDGIINAEVQSKLSK